MSEEVADERERGREREGRRESERERGGERGENQFGQTAPLLLRESNGSTMPLSNFTPLMPPLHCLSWPHPIYEVAVLIEGQLVLSG